MLQGAINLNELRPRYTPDVLCLNEKEPWQAALPATPIVVQASTFQRSDSTLAAAYARDEDFFEESASSNYQPAHSRHGASVELDFTEGRIRLRSDFIGKVCLYFFCSGTELFFSTNLRWLCTQLETPKINKQALYEYTYFHMVPAPISTYIGVAKMRAGSYVEFSSDGKLAEGYYWLPDFSQKTGKEERALHIDLRDTLRRAVSKNLQENANVGAFLSGGLDSSTVAGLLSELSEKQVEAFSIGFNADGYDEIPFARITAQHFGIKLHEYYVTPDDVVEALPTLAAAFEEPFGNSSALPAYFCAKFAAENGIDILLAGDGGDEIFAGNERYLQQTPYERFRGIPKVLRTAIAQLTHLLPQSTTLGQKGRSFLDKAEQALPDRLYHYSFLEQFAPERVFTDDFLQEIDLYGPSRKYREVFAAPVTADVMDRMLFHDWQFTLADNDLRKVSTACTLGGVQVRYPMLDKDLIDLSTTIPTHLKTANGNLRSFYKDAFTGWLPDQTINKSKHGFGLPFGVWMRDHKPLRELAYDTINQLKHRKIIRADFLDQALEHHRAGHASYYGELVWILTVLEIWLQAHDL